MNAAYDVAQERIEEKLVVLLARMEQAQAAGETLTPTWLYQEVRYRALIEQIEDELSQLAAGQAEPLKVSQAGFVEAAAAHAEQLTLAALGPAPEAAPAISIGWNVLPRQAIEAIVGFASDGSPLRDLLDDLGVEASRRVREELIAGVARGESLRKLAKTVQAITGAEGTVGITRARALNIVRTESHRAARAASLDLYRRNVAVIVGWTWIAACDSRTCCCCWSMHGSLHGLEETLDGHPQCRCIAAPRTKSWGDITGDSTLPDTRPVIVPGEERFAALPAAEQEAILGPGLYQLYQGGSIRLADTVTQTHDARWGSMRRPATIEEAQASAGK